MILPCHLFSAIGVNMSHFHLDVEQSHYLTWEIYYLQEATVMCCSLRMCYKQFCVWSMNSIMRLSRLLTMPSAIVSMFRHDCVFVVFVWDLEPFTLIIWAKIIWFRCKFCDFCENYCSCKMILARKYKNVTQLLTQHT